MLNCCKQHLPSPAVAHAPQAKQAAPAVEQPAEARLELEAPSGAGDELGAESAVEAVRDLHAGECACSDALVSLLLPRHHPSAHKSVHHVTPLPCT